jgi:hypothetical protein
VFFLKIRLKVGIILGSHMSTFFMKASVLGASKDGALVSKRAAFVLQSKKRREIPM